MLKTPNYHSHVEINDYLNTLSDRNLVRFYLDEIHDISLGRSVNEFFTYSKSGPRRRLVKLGVFYKHDCGYGQLAVNWQRVWDILG
jgi:hypothetical protein